MLNAGYNTCQKG